MTKNGDKQVDFSAPDAGEYAKRISDAKGAHSPVGAVPMPQMPRLDQAPQPRHRGVQERGGKTMRPEEYEKAVSSGQVMPGMGGAYRANQPSGGPSQAPQGPAMERTSQDGNPVNPPRAEGGLRTETQDALKAVAQANTEEDKPLSKEDESYLTKLGEETKDILRNKERKAFIEKRISDELNFEDLLYQQELRQNVPIRKGFTPTFRTPSAAEDLFIKRLISKEEGSPQYIIDKYSAMSLVCGLFALNGKPLPDHCDTKRNPQDELFQIKFDMIMHYPLILVADMSANFVWFEERVQNLMSLEAIQSF